MDATRIQPPPAASAEAVVKLRPLEAGEGTTLADKAYAAVRRRIVRVELAPGAAFSETDIAATLKIGKTPVREALARLRLDGLVEVQPRSGYRVVAATLQDANDVCELRAMLEGESARVAAARARQAAPYLTSLDKRFEPRDGRSNLSVHEWIDADCALHLELARVAGNARLVDALDRVLLLFARLSYLSLEIDPATNFQVHGHDDLISAIADGDGDRARMVIEAEVRQCQELIVHALMSSESVIKANVDIRSSANKFYLDIPKQPA
jgi:DNA-binding GntR family transcriptional regulator